MRIQETDRGAEDRRLLEDIRLLLLEYRGNDEVSLEIAVNGRIVMLDWPVVRVRICPELQHGLQQLLGSRGSISVEHGAE